MKTILMPILTVGFAGLLTIGHAEAREFTPPSIVHTKSKAVKLCKEVRGKAPLRKTIDDNLRTDGKVRRAHVRTITNESCKFYAASQAEQRKYWNQTLDKLVAQGLLTRADKKALSRLPFDATVLEQWTPTTDFGRHIKDQSNDTPQANEANSGAGFVIGAIIGGAIGFGAAGPAGIAPGVAIGGAAGNLTETAVDHFSGDATNGGEDGGGDGGGDGDGE
jgi:hypothetical protein